MAMLKFTIEVLEALFDNDFSLSEEEPSEEKERALCLLWWAGYSEIEDRTRDLVDKDEAG